MNIGTACCHSPDCADTKCEGRPDPALTRRVQESELRWQCRDQMSARQLYEHARAGDFGVGEEAANPSIVKPPREAMPVQLLDPEPFDWQALVLWIAVAVAFVSVAALSIADPRDLSTLWPKLVAAVSF